MGMGGVGGQEASGYDCGYGGQENSLGFGRTIVGNDRRRSW